MLGKQAVKKLADRVLAMSEAEQTEVMIFTEDSSLTRFANNEIHQNVADRDASVSVRAFMGKRFGVVNTNDLSDAGLRSAIDESIVIAKTLPLQEDLLALPKPQSIPEINGASLASAEFGPLQRAAAVRLICEMAAAKGMQSAGAFRIDNNHIVIANSEGLYAHHQTTSAELLALAMTGGSSGYATEVEVDASKINPERVAQEAIRRADEGRNPQPLPAGDYEVILEELAVGDLMDFMGYLAFGALAVQEGRSFLSNKLGQRVLGSNVSIWDDGLDPSGIVRPFDFEGMPKQRVDIVRDGIATSPVYDRRTAVKDGKTSTGHALPPGNYVGPVPMNLFLGPGDATREQMIQSVKRGLLVTRFWYTRVVHPLTVTMTGMTRDGTFLIENGKVVGPVQNLRFTQSYVEALNNVGMVARDTRLVRDFGSPNRVPALKIDKWTFTGTTEY